MGFWAARKEMGSSKLVMRVRDLAGDAATLSLHVICAAGFGVPQLWAHEEEETLDGRGVDGFSGGELKGGHEMSFKMALQKLLGKLLWFAVLSPRSMSMCLLAFLSVQ